MGWPVFPDHRSTIRDGAPGDPPGTHSTAIRLSLVCITGLDICISVMILRTVLLTGQNSNQPRSLTYATVVEFCTLARYVLVFSVCPSVARYNSRCYMAGGNFGVRLGFEKKQLSILSGRMVNGLTHRHPAIGVSFDLGIALESSPVLNTIGWVSPGCFWFPRTRC